MVTRGGPIDCTAPTTRPPQLTHGPTMPGKRTPRTRSLCFAAWGLVCRARPAGEQPGKQLLDRPLDSARRHIGQVPGCPSEQVRAAVHSDVSNGEVAFSQQFLDILGVPVTLTVAVLVFVSGSYPRVPVGTPRSFCLPNTDNRRPIPFRRRPARRRPHRRQKQDRRTRRG